VRFTAETAHRTRVEIEHRNLERHGEGREGTRDGIAGDQGCSLYLRRFADVLARKACVRVCQGRRSRDGAFGLKANAEA
jgi:hypothetical protein